MTSNKTMESRNKTSQDFFHKPCLSSLVRHYLTCFEKDFHVSIDGLSKASLTSSDDENSTNLGILLSQLLDKLLLLWREVSSNKAWAMEKLKDFFCKYIANSPEALKVSNFNSFILGLMESRHLIQYPDFVMNNVALMASEVFLSSPGFSCERARKAAFQIIRSPFEYWTVNKGCRAAVTFECCHRLIQRQISLDLFEESEFDASLTVAFALASPQNYTRKAASHYFIQLVDFAFSEKTSLQASSRSKLKSIICDVFISYNSHFSGKGKDSSRTNVEYFEDLSGTLLLRYIKLLSDCTVCEGWSEYCAGSDSLQMLETIVQWLKTSVSDQSFDAQDVIVPCVDMLIDFIIKRVTYITCCFERLLSPSSKKMERTGLTLDTVAYLSQKLGKACASDLVSIAAKLLSSCDCSSADQQLLTDLALLPSLLICGVKIEPCHFVPAHLISAVTEHLRKEMTSDRPQMIKCALGNVFRLWNTKCSHSDRASLLEYLTLRTDAPPPEVSTPLVQSGRISNEFGLVYITQAFTYMDKTADAEFVPDDGKTFRAMETYVEACLKLPRISYSQLSIVLKFYKSVLLCKLGKFVPDSAGVSHQEITAATLENVLDCLRFKIVDVDSRVRETAVQGIGEFYQTDSAHIQHVMEKNGILPLMLSCLQDQAENVATAVVEVLLSFSRTRSVEKLLALFGTTLEVVTSSTKEFLVSGQWDNIKPPSFCLLTHLCPHDQVLQYAEVALRQDNARLAQFVLEYIRTCVKQCTAERDTNVEKAVTDFQDLLLRSWGDLVLSQINAQDTCAFRLASEILTDSLVFLESSDVRQLVEKQCAVLCDEKFPESCQALSASCLNTSSLKERSSCQRSATSSTDLESISEPNNGVSDLHNEEEETPAKKRRKVDEISGSVCLLCAVNKFYPGTESHKSRTSIQENSAEASELNRFSFEKSEHKFHDLHKTEEFEDDFLDSTKEPLPWRLRTEPLPSKTFLELLGGEETENSEFAKLKPVILMKAFESVLTELKPAKLQEEALRSTDEYERSPLTLLSDMDHLLEQSLHSAVENLEGDLIPIFMSDVEKLILSDKGTLEVREKKEMLLTVTKIQIQIETILTQKESFAIFVLRHRRTVWMDQGYTEAHDFVLQKFLERMELLKKNESKSFHLQKFFTDAADLSTLMDMYVEEHRNFASGNTSLNAAVPPLVHENPSLPQEEASKLSEQLEKLTSPSENVHAFLDGLTQPHISALHRIFNRETVTDDILKKDLDSLLKWHKQKAYSQILLFLQSILQPLCMFALEGDSEKKDNLRSRISSLLCALQNWFLSEESEFDSDGDNDPTLIDCF